MSGQENSKLDVALDALRNVAYAGGKPGRTPAGYREAREAIKALGRESEAKTEVLTKAISKIEALQVELSAVSAEANRQAGNAAYCINKLNDALRDLAVTSKARDEARDHVGNLTAELHAIRRTFDLAVRRHHEERSGLVAEIAAGKAIASGMGQHLDILIHTLGTVQGLPVNAVQ